MLIFQVAAERKKPANMAEAFEARAEDYANRQKAQKLIQEGEHLLSGNFANGGRPFLQKAEEKFEQAKRLDSSCQESADQALGQACMNEGLRQLQESGGAADWQAGAKLLEKAVGLWPNTRADICEELVKAGQRAAQMGGTQKAQDYSRLAQSFLATASLQP